MESSRKWTIGILSFIATVIGGLVGQVIWEEIMQTKYDNTTVDCTVGVACVAGDEARLRYAQFSLERFSDTLADAYISAWQNDHKISSEEWAHRLEDSLFFMLEAPTEYLKEGIEYATKKLNWLEKHCSDYGTPEDSAWYVRCHEYIDQAYVTISHNDSIKNRCRERFYDKYNAFRKEVDLYNNAADNVAKAEQVLFEAQIQRDSLIKATTGIF